MRGRSQKDIHPTFTLTRVSGDRTHPVSGGLGLQRIRNTARELPNIDHHGTTAFDELDQPLWIFDRESLGFLFVNSAAQDWLGYPADDLFGMTISDIRPERDRVALRTAVTKVAEPTSDGGTWRIVTKSGDVRDASFRWRPILFHGRDAVLATVNDVTSLRRAEQKANLATWEKDGFIEGISDGFFVVDRDWTLVYINTRAEQVWSRPRDTLLGKNIWAEFPDAVGSIFQAEYARAMDTGVTVRFEEFYAPLGIWLALTVYPTADGLAVHFRDISEERRKAQQFLLLEAAVSRLNEILLITEATPIDAPGGPKIVYVNDAFCTLTGYSRQEAIGNTPRMLQGPGTDRRELARIRDAIAHARPVHCEVLNYSRLGAEYWLELDISPLFGADGKPTHFVAVQRDVTARRQLQEAQSISDERFRLVSKAANEVIWDWDMRTDAFWWNERMQSLFGHDPATLPRNRESWGSLLHPDDVARVAADFEKVLTLPDTTWLAEFRFRRADGTYAVVSTQASLVRDANGNALRMVGSMRDVTQQRLMEDQLREALKLEAVGQLTGGIAHDFNNLLTVILGVGELLSERLQGDDKLRALAEMTIAAAEQGAELTGQLLSFARRQPLEPRVLDANQLVRGIQGLVRRAVTAGIEFELLLDPGLWPIEVDQPQLESALLNLAINARDAMPEGGRLSFETANCHLDGARTHTHGAIPEGDYVVISVVDNGTGMTPETRDRVFEPFFTTKQVGQGSGLGLSMVQGFVTQSRGHVEVSSDPGEGTTFKMYYPRSTGIVTAVARPESNDHPVGGTEHVLIVEDDEWVREVLFAQLGGLGYRVSVAINGPDALARPGQFEDVDLLLTDVVMPGGMSGRELASIAVRRKPGLPVLFVTGYSEDEIVHGDRLDPGIDLLRKPYLHRDLANKVRGILDRDLPDPDLTRYRTGARSA